VIHAHGVNFNMWAKEVKLKIKSTKVQS